MLLKYSLLAVFGWSVLVGCGGGRASSPSEPAGSEEPAPDPQQPRTEAQNPSPAAQAPQIAGEEPAPNAQRPEPVDSSQFGGEGGASPGDP